VEVVKLDPLIAGVLLGVLGEAGAAHHDSAAGADVLDDGGELPDGVHVSWAAAVTCLHDGELIVAAIGPSDRYVDLPLLLGRPAG
jgi:hypothetical protein